jgi:PKD repeat protein
VRPDNLLYFVDEVKWDVENDGDIDHTGKTYEHTINTEGSLPIQVTYVFKHRKNSSDVIEVSQRIYIESSKKEAILDLQLKADSEYAPATVKFDASQSKIKDDNIVKFIYDYGDGIVEERDAQNL